MFARVYLSLHLFTYVTVYSFFPMFTSFLVHVYICFTIITRVYLWLHLFTYVYPCLLVLLMFTRVYPCLPVYQFIRASCVPMVTHD